MTEELFRQDATLAQCRATVLAVTEAGVRLSDFSRAVEEAGLYFPPHPGDESAMMGGLVATNAGGKDTDGAATGRIVHLPAPDQREALSKLVIGETVLACIDMPRRRRLMRFHTASHLLCHLVPVPVNGCSITPEHARIDFHMSEPLDKEQLTAGLARLVAAGWPVVVGSVTDAELDAHPELVKSMSVQPPRGSGTVRTIRIGAAPADAERIGAAPADAERIGAPGSELIDLQPCGGTHVANTAEIGAVVVTRIEKKSAMTRRVVLGLVD